VGPYLLAVYSSLPQAIIDGRSSWAPIFTSQYATQTSPSPGTLSGSYISHGSSVGNTSHHPNSHSFIQWMHSVLSLAAHAPLLPLPLIPRPSFSTAILFKIVPGAQSRAPPSPPSPFTVERYIPGMTTHPHSVYYHVPTIRHRRIHTHHSP
jgi:hypothetical protein